MNRLLIVLLMTFGAPQASAADRSGNPVNAGRFLCHGCDVRTTLGGGAPLDGTAEAFLKSLSLIKFTNGDRMVVGDRATICDGSVCVDVILMNIYAQTWVISPKGIYPDSGAGYKNAGVGRIEGSGNTFFVAVTYPDPFTGLPQVTRRWTICADTTCVSGTTAVIGSESLMLNEGFGQSFSWSGDTNANGYAGGPSYSAAAGYNSHGTVNGRSYGGVGVYNGSCYGSSGLAPGDSVNIGNGGWPTVRRDNY